MWRLLMIVLFCFCILGGVYTVFRFHRLDFVRRLGQKRRLLSWLISLFPLAFSALFLLINPYTAAVVLVHFVLFWLLGDLAAWIVKKLRRKPYRHDYAGYIVLAFTLIWLGIGWYNAHHVYTTFYTFPVERLDAPLRVALVADSHLGITQTKENFPKEMEKLQAQHPDLLILAGDFVDDDSSREDMLAACEALGKLDLPYGVYFIYGNHDAGYFRYRSFSGAELEAALAANGVTILKDEALLVDDRFYILGRLDRSYHGRADMETLTAGLDPTKPLIVADHQPTDYAAQAAAGADLVVSGHTHGGHLFPMGQIGLLMGPNNRFKGAETRGSTHFVVTSGISGWAVPIKTGCASEVVLIDLIPQ